VGTFQKDEDYAFTSFPMPYDIKITYKKDAAPVDMYKVVPSPGREALSDNVLNKIGDLMLNANPKDLVQKQKDNQMAQHIREGLWIDPSTIKYLSDKDAEEIRQIKERAMKGSQSSEIIGGEIPF
jgi:hypothetical protein